MHNRRLVTAVIAIAALSLAALAGCSKGGGSPITTNDVTLGSDTAPVTIIEYASLACPFCAKFNNENFETLKKKYIDTGQVKFVQREMLLHNPQLSAAGFLLARCSGKENYFKVTDGIYKADEEMDQTGEYSAGLLKVARSVGMNQAQLDACIQDEKAIEALNTRVENNMNKEGIHSTPTFIVNGKQINSTGGGVPSMADLDRAIAEARGAAGAPAPKATP